MSDLETTTIRLPPELLEEARRREGFNVSGHCRQFLQEILAGGHSTETALAIRRERLESELSDAKSEVERLEREIEHITEQLQEKKQDRRKLFEELETAELAGEPAPDHSYVEQLAQKAGKRPAEFWQDYREWCQA